MHSACNPVFENDQASAGWHGEVYGIVEMSEDEIIRLFVHTEFIEGFVLPAEPVAPVFAAVGIAPVRAETEGQPGMQAAEEYLQEAAMEDAQKHAIAEFGTTQPVSVAEKETLAIDLHRLRLENFLYPQALEERVTPDVVVARDEIHFYSLGHHLYKFAEHPGTFARHHIAVFIPEIPDIPEEP